MTNTILVKASVLAQRNEIIFAETTLKTPSKLVYTNSDIVCSTPFTERMLNNNLCYEESLQAVSLNFFEDPTLMLGGGTYWPVSGDHVVSEQVQPGLADVAAIRAHHENARYPRVDVDGEVVLLARYGAVTWGHWLGEILPKAVVAEHAYPGRFRYALPRRLLGDDKYSIVVQQSLGAYGIDPSRWVAIDDTCAYAFARLIDVSGVAMHIEAPPAVLRLMKDTVARGEGSNVKRIALLRGPEETRGVHNHQEIRELLTNDGYAFCTMADMSFVEQVAMVSDVDRLVGIWGSGLIWLMFVPDGASVVSLGPGDWEDGYFVSLLKRCSSCFADVRGLPLWDGTGSRRDAKFHVNARHLSDALAAVSNGPKGTRLLEVASRLTLVEDTRPVVSFGFGRNGEIERHLGAGWSYPEAQHRWSLGLSCELRLSDLQLPTRCFARLAVGALSQTPHLASHPVTIVMNGVEVLSACVTHFSHLVWRIPDDVASSGEIHLKILHPICPSPSTLGINEDARPLGLMFFVLSLHSENE